MLLLNCEVNLILICSKNCVIASNTAVNQEKTFAITNKYKNLCSN